MEKDDTIVALSTSDKGKGALAIIRVSGERALSVVEKIIKENKRFLHSETGKINLFKVLDFNRENVIDEITVIKYEAPKSFTGEDMAELICHGGRIIIKKILEALIDAGARYAEKGEFTRRAFCNGKTDLIKAESINQLILCNNALQHKRIIKNYLGVYEETLKRWRGIVGDILVDIESELEFNEEDDISERGEKERKERVKRFKEEVYYEMEKRERIKEKEGLIDVTIAGPVNAGKSTIMNLLMGYERSIVDSEGGTTRDFVSEIKVIDDKEIRFIDTAGLVKTGNRVERKGVEKSEELIRRSNIIVWVTAADDKEKPEEKEIIDRENHRCIGIINKMDRADGKAKEIMFNRMNIQYIKTVAINKEERKRIEEFICNRIEWINDEVEDNCIITNKRQESLIKGIYKEIEEIEERFGEEEIMSIHCKNVLNMFDEFMGKTVPEDIINRIFDEFCIGK